MTSDLAEDKVAAITAEGLRAARADRRCCYPITPEARVLIHLQRDRKDPVQRELLADVFDRHRYLGRLSWARTDIEARKPDSMRRFHVA